MPYLPTRGNPLSPLWILLERPYPSDIPKAQIFSGGLAYVYDKMLKEAGFSAGLDSCYVCARRPDTDDPGSFRVLENDIAHYHPPVLLAVNEVGAYFLKELQSKDEAGWKGQLQKYAGSLLQSPKIPYEHYIMPVYGPDRCVADWTERNITTYVDFQKLRDELEYWKKNGALQKLPERTLKYGNLEIGELLNYIEHQFSRAEILSVDIETVYPRKGSAFLPHPGYPITIGIADSSFFGISFNLFRESPVENRILWRALEKLFRGKKLLGQNFFNFDALFLEALGFEIPLDSVRDTLIRHHILWPELSHKLQFMTRQYTREPYYKDEGKHWSVKQMDSLRRYNCLDVCVTYEIYERQEEEFKQRPHLR